MEIEKTFLKKNRFNFKASNRNSVEMKCPKSFVFQRQSSTRLCGLFLFRSFTVIIESIFACLAQNHKFLI